MWNAALIAEPPTTAISVTLGPVTDTLPWSGRTLSLKRKEVSE